MTAKMIKSLLDSIIPKKMLVIGDLPAALTNAVGIVEYDGNHSTEYFGPQLGSSVFRPIIKIVIRNSDYKVGSEYAESIKKALHRYHDDYFLSILVQGDIMYLGRSPEKNHEFQITCTTQVKE